MALIDRLKQAGDALSAFSEGVGKLASWGFVVLLGIIIFDVITRRFFVLGSTALQEMEWHLHTFLFCFGLAFGYVRDTHVRVELVYEQLTPRAQAIIELLGILLLLLPFIITIIYFSSSFAFRAFESGEISSAGTGLSHRWIVKSFVPLGFGLLLLAALGRAFNSIYVIAGGAPRSPAR